MLLEAKAVESSSAAHCKNCMAPHMMGTNFESAPVALVDILVLLAFAVAYLNYF